MTTEQRTRAIAFFENRAKLVTMPGAAEMCGLAVEALNAMDAGNEPLTLEQLRGLDGEPVYIVGRLYGGWTVPWRNAAKYIARCPDEANISHYPKDYGKTWLAYRRKPEKEK